MTSVIITPNKYHLIMTPQLIANEFSMHQSCWESTDFDFGRLRKTIRQLFTHLLKRPDKCPSYWIVKNCVICIHISQLCLKIKSSMWKINHMNTNKVQVHILVTCQIDIWLILEVNWFVSPRKFFSLMLLPSACSMWVLLGLGLLYMENCFTNLKVKSKIIFYPQGDDHCSTSQICDKLFHGYFLGFISYIGWTNFSEW